MVLLISQNWPAEWLNSHIVEGGRVDIAPAASALPTGTFEKQVVCGCDGVVLVRLYAAC